MSRGGFAIMIGAFFVWGLVVGAAYFLGSLAKPVRTYEAGYAIAVDSVRRIPRACCTDTAYFDHEARGPR